MTSNTRHISYCRHEGILMRKRFHCLNSENIKIKGWKFMQSESLLFSIVNLLWSPQKYFFKNWMVHILFLHELLCIYKQWLLQNRNKKEQLRELIKSLFLRKCISYTMYWWRKVNRSRNNARFPKNQLRNTVL